MQPYVWNLGDLAQAFPAFAKVAAMAAAAARGENPFSAVARLRPHVDEQFAGGLREWNTMRAFLFGRGRRLAPSADLKIEVGPARREKLAAPCAGQEQEPDGIGRADIGA